MRVRVLKELQRSRVKTARDLALLLRIDLASLSGILYRMGSRAEIEVVPGAGPRGGNGYRLFQ